MKLVFATLALMSIVLASPSAAASPFKARPVTDTQVQKMLYKFRGSFEAIRGYGEISVAIANASTQDPLFPHVEEGSELTAAILVAVAWWESRFIPSAVGDNGKSFGLFQIQPPSSKINSKMLTVPREAAFVAIDLIRQSIKHCIEKKRDWREALAWYAASSEFGAKHPKIIIQSRRRMETAAALFADVFGLPEERISLMLSQKEE